MRYVIAIGALMLVWFTSCEDTNRVYEENMDIPAQVWNKDHLVEFQFDIADTLLYYNFVVNLRHTTFYPNSNLWLMVYTTYPDGTEQEQRLQLNLANENGEWEGSCTGDICDVKHFIQQNAYFNQTGTYKLAFEQIMRTDDLTDILAFGLRVEKAGPRDLNKTVAKPNAADTTAVNVGDSSAAKGGDSSFMDTVR